MEQRFVLKKRISQSINPLFLFFLGRGRGVSIMVTCTTRRRQMWPCAERISKCCTYLLHRGGSFLHVSSSTFTFLIFGLRFNRQAVCSRLTGYIVVSWLHCRFLFTIDCCRGNVVPLRMGEGRYSSTHFNPCCVRKWVVSFTPPPLYPRDKNCRYWLARRLGGLHSRSGRFACTGNRTPDCPGNSLVTIAVSCIVQVRCSSNAPWCTLCRLRATLRIALNTRNTKVAGPANSAGIRISGVECQHAGGRREAGGSGRLMYTDKCKALSVWCQSTSLRNCVSCNPTVWRRRGRH